MPSQPDHGRSRVSQTAPKQRSISEQQWAAALKDPSFRKAIDEGLADEAASRVTPWSEVKKRLG